MLSTVEMRWFFEECPLDGALHFTNVGELQTRVDWYSMPCNPACGIKVREGRFESKLRTARMGERDFGRFAGQLEQWTKWSLDYVDDVPPKEELLEEVGWISVAKTRRLKRYSVNGPDVSVVDERPENGCEFELTELRVLNQTFWTVGFEAVGADSVREANLATVVAEVTRTGGVNGSFELSNSLGYADWLCRWNR